MDKVAPSSDGVSIEGSDNSEAEVMTFLVMEEVKAANVLTDGVVEDETLVAMLGHLVSGSAKDDVHKYELAEKIVLFNTDRMYGKQDIFIAIAKKEIAVMITDISFEFRFSRL